MIKRFLKRLNRKRNLIKVIIEMGGAGTTVAQVKDTVKELADMQKECSCHCTLFVRFY